jgi:hypothetical protein
MSCLMSSFSLDGQGRTEITAEEPLEMKRWYTVKVDRDRREGLLLVDGSLVANGSASRALTESLPDMSHLFVGRLPPDVSDYASLPTRAGYVGCLADLKIEPDHIDLTKGSTILDTANVQPGCEEAPQNTLSFPAGGSAGYVQMPRATANGSISFSFVFRTGSVVEPEP